MGETIYHTIDNSEQQYLLLKFLPQIPWVVVVVAGG